LFDFSKIDDLKPLARLTKRIQAASTGIPFVIAGAQARDLLLRHGHAVDTGRQTADVDFAFRVSTWEEFLGFREALIAADFTAVRGKLHKLLYGKLEIDILPFGEIESNEHTIAWPPDRDVVMSMFGFREAFDSATDVRLPEDASTKVTSLPALALLKIEAWRERRLREPGKDAHDIRLILTNYMQAGSDHRLHDEFSRLLEDPEFDYGEAGAYILGRDVKALLDEKGLKHVLDIVTPEANPDGALHLVGDMKMEPAKALKLLGALRAGLSG
jgi:predicted nucleotidyltransferase